MDSFACSVANLMCSLANISGALMPLDTHQSQEIAIIDAEGLSLALCDLMLQVLSRDNALRRAYVQRRWQARFPNTDITACDRRTDRVVPKPDKTQGALHVQPA
jgi:hypothetical protein